MIANVTKVDLRELGKDLESRIDKAVDDLSAIIGTFAQSMHTEISELKAHQDSFDVKLDKLTNTIDGFIGRIDSYETELVARDAQFERLLDWAREVSKKTGVPLKNL